MSSPNDILALIKDPSAEDQTLIEKAYQFAEKAHEGQKRYSGEPYFNHALETAKILAELGMGAKSIAAGLLHDLLEDAGVKPEIVEKEFGKEILFLVEGVTKLGKLRYHGAERHIESLRKLFVAMSEDLRVLIINLADRLHNMRTIQFVPKEKQQRIAAETLEIYAPLSYRLGVRKLTRELENLSFPYVYPKEYEIVKEVIKQKSKNMDARIVKFTHSVKKALAKKGITQIKTDYRIKSYWSIYKKLVRKNMDADKIYDISALRIIVPTVADCYQVLGIIHGSYRPLPGRIKDYIAFPKPNDYQSIHTTVFTGDGDIMEVQIRTEEMHRGSEYGIASHITYKEYPRFKKGEGESAAGIFAWILKLLPKAVNFGRPKEDAKPPSKISYEGVPSWIKELAEYQEKSVGEKEFMENLKSDFFEHRIFVFTPKGDVVDLPIDSSPIDFAYAIHSDIGDRMCGAKVNGKLVSLDTALKNGDIIEIQTKNICAPTAKWMEVAKTAVAKKKIRAILDKQAAKTKSVGKS